MKITKELLKALGFYRLNTFGKYTYVYEWYEIKISIAYLEGAWMVYANWVPWNGEILRDMSDVAMHLAYLGDAVGCKKTKERIRKTLPEKIGHLMEGDSL
jgi:hypothetical protein